MHTGMKRYCHRGGRGLSPLAIFVPRQSPGSEDHIAPLSRRSPQKATKQREDESSKSPSSNFGTPLYLTKFLCRGDSRHASRYRHLGRTSLEHQPCPLTADDQPATLAQSGFVAESSSVPAKEAFQSPSPQIRCLGWWPFRGTETVFLALRK
jgi:hypothetical protein